MHNTKYTIPKHILVTRYGVRESLYLNQPAKLNKTGGGFQVKIDSVEETVIVILIVARDNGSRELLSPPRQQ